MKIGLFGGTFDPIHKGHILIAQHACKTLNLDKIILIPANQNPDKKNQPSASNQDRYNMVKIAIQDFDNFEVSDFEIKRTGPSYTFETLKYFKQKYSQDELFFILGSDNLSSLNKWQGVNDFSKWVKLVCFRRTKNFSKINAKKYNVLILDNPLWDFAATEYRQGNIKIVDSRVQSYIGKNFLYARDLILNTLSISRNSHCFSTGEYAAQLAKQLNYDVKTAYYAGLLHDITKEWTNEQHEQMIQKYGLNFKDYHPYQYHQLTAYLFLKNEYKITNKSILHAIKHHTTLSIKPTTLEKIVYVSDKIGPGRRWPGIQKLRQDVEQNFDLGFANLVASIWEFLTSEGQLIDAKQQKIYATNSKFTL
ncbi:nicotinate-nucleotide adenylyltransferase [Mycoplasma sp. 1573]